MSRKRRRDGRVGSEWYGKGTIAGSLAMSMEHIKGFQIVPSLLGGTGEKKIKFGGNQF